MSEPNRNLSNMSSRNDWGAALDAVDRAQRAVAALPFHTLQPADQRALLIQLDELQKILAAKQRQLLAHVVAGPPPVEFAGAPWAKVLARRLRISEAEARRRIADAGREAEAEAGVGTEAGREAGAA
jgi:hypothetical protein